MGYSTMYMQKNITQIKCVVRGKITVSDLPKNLISHPQTHSTEPTKIITPVCDLPSVIIHHHTVRNFSPDCPTVAVASVDLVYTHLLTALASRASKAGAWGRSR